MNNNTTGGVLQIFVLPVTWGQVAVLACSPIFTTTYNWQVMNKPNMAEKMTIIVTPKPNLLLSHISDLRH